MADFAQWVTATEAFADGAFIRAFEHAATEAIESVAESDAVVVAIGAFMIERNSWTGTAAELLHTLSREDRAESVPSKWKTWPAEPSSFSKRLRKAAAVLRKMDISVEIGRASDRTRTRTIALSKIEVSERPKVPTVRRVRPVLAHMWTLRTVRTLRTLRTDQPVSSKCHDAIAPAACEAGHNNGE